MPRKRNIVARTPRSSGVVYPEKRTAETFLTAARALMRWPHLWRVVVGNFQRERAHVSKPTERETVSLEAWDALVREFDEDTMLSTPLTREFLDACAGVLEDNEIPPPADAADGWVNTRMLRVRDLIKRHRARLQPSPQS